MHSRLHAVTFKTKLFLMRFLRSPGNSKSEITGSPSTEPFYHGDSVLSGGAPAPECGNQPRTLSERSKASLKGALLQGSGFESRHLCCNFLAQNLPWEQRNGKNSANRWPAVLEPLEADGLGHGCGAHPDALARDAVH
jgi:hypothetical protein